MEKKLRSIIFRPLLIIPLLLWSMQVSAQSDFTGTAPVTRVYAVTNATITTAPGKILDNATIIFDNGLISAVGKNITIPKNAEVIDGTGLYIYPGFIDGMAYTGAKRPKDPERPDKLFAPDPPAEFAGITPENSVINQLDAGDSNIKSMREKGFTIVHTVPYGRMLPGSGALITLIETTDKYELLINEDASLYTQFVGAPGAYPSNALGIMAKWRNLYRNAEILKQHTELYAANATGLPRPVHDLAYEAFFPVIEKKKSVYYNASSTLEAQRALRLQKDLGFPLTLGNLKEGWDLTNLIKNSDTKVFLSLDLPKKPQALSGDDLTDEAQHLQQRRMDFWNKYVTQPQTMDRAGIKYGFSTMGLSTSKVQENLQVLIDNGLSEENALAALTINAAELLQINNIAGTLENGKLANAVITTAPVFTKDAFIKYMFVDGQKFSYDKTAASDTSNGDIASVAGNWTFSIASPEGMQSGRMVIKLENNTLNGALSGLQGMPDVAMRNLALYDGNLSFDFTIEFGNETIEVAVSGPVNQNNFDGTAYIAAAEMSLPLTAVKDGRK